MSLTETCFYSQLYGISNNKRKLRQKVNYNAKIDFENFFLKISFLWKLSLLRFMFENQKLFDKQLI